ncbi:beta-galactosidase [Cellulomonas marina]|uniref:Beta-galactosidase n=1 Tax=Cellulomonas marina TaxID=988821 RepID=A0A1I1AFB4_9CELL|nr:beta-galactosidase [Cellulomonas marina]GIG29710.1 beta-galactosidase [Cellulomonas marina]SFB36056.1 beta-galactosidase [Cellulomonas marina]
MTQPATTDPTPDPTPDPTTGPTDGAPPQAAATARLSERLQYGGDYNPEQWDPAVWEEDVTLMQQAGVTLATVGVFSWARLEPRPKEYDLAWLDDVLDRLHRGGVRVLLATATASPPAWLAREHPSSLPVTADGVTLHPGSRQQYSPSSSAYREHALRLVETLAERYGDHPALAAWHVNNEYGCHVPRSYDAESVAAFRAWLAERYGTVERLNEAWGTAFWSQRYDSFDEVDAPRAMPTFANPTQVLDFDRFSSDALLALHRTEVDVLRRVTPAVPVTTNFMGFFKAADYWAWAPHVDVVTDDAYPDPADPEAYVRLAASRDLMRSLRDGQPWLLMESATSAVNWRAANAPKPAGLHRAQSLQAVGRGADGILHFQWRQSAAGAEKFHSGMVPHVGPDSRVFREVCALGRELAELSAEVAGTRVPSRVALLLDWDSWRAVEQEAVPARTDYVEHLLAWYRPFLRRGVTVDLRPPGADLSGYDLVVAPLLQVASTEELEGLDAYVRGGGHLVVGYGSAVLDRDLHVRLGGYLGPLQGTLGVRVEEQAPLVGAPGAAAPVTRLAGAPGDAVDGGLSGTATTWQEVLQVQDAQVLATFADGHAAGGAALTRRTHGAGAAWYVATLPDEALLDALVDRWTGEAGVEPLLTAPTAGVEAVRRGEVLVVVNHTPQAVRVPLAGGARTVAGHDALVLRG